jgi:hypothetical protein
MFAISEEWSIDGQKLYYTYQDEYDGQELWEESNITWIYYDPYQLTIETNAGILLLSRLAKNYVGLTCVSSHNEYTHPIKLKWKKLIKFLVKNT